MSGQRKSSDGFGHGVMIALALSGVFLGLTVLTTPLVAALVVVPTSIALGAIRAHSVPLATPHSLSHPSYGSVARVEAPRASGVIDTGTVTPAA